MSDNDIEELRTKLFWIDKFPLSAHNCIIVEEMLRDLLKYHQLYCKKYEEPDLRYIGLLWAISYFETMGSFKAEQEHQDAFCTPIIEGS